MVDMLYTDNRGCVAPPYGGGNIKRRPDNMSGLKGRKMARFRGRIRGNRGEASRLGVQRIDTYADGWYIGAHTTVYAQEEIDCAASTLTGGSIGIEPMDMGYRYKDGKAEVYIEGYRLVLEGGTLELQHSDGKIITVIEDKIT
jgi:hypothetical protein